MNPLAAFGIVAMILLLAWEGYFAYWLVKLMNRDHHYAPLCIYILGVIFGTYILAIVGVGFYFFNPR